MELIEDSKTRTKKKDLEKQFDLIIIGGGINGAGVARDAAERGLSVLLLDKNDFAAGCTAHSTRLIHGGLRYLKYLELGLVYESLHEREVLLRNYPHLVKPIGLLLPHFKNSKNSKFSLSLGMWLYDLLSWGKSLDSHRAFSVKELQQSILAFDISKFKQEGLDGSYYYHDAQVVLAERLCLENILVAQENGAICLNHYEVKNINLIEENGKYKVDSVEFEDMLADQTGSDKRNYTARAKNVINLAGPWVDYVNKRTRLDEESLSRSSQGEILLKKRMGGTKGSHILVKDFPGAPEDYGVYLEAHSDGRPFFILPFQAGENERHCLIGTTDIFVKENELDNPKMSDEEISYLLSEVNYFFPRAALTQESVLRTFCGVRPLPYVAEGDEAAVTRKHSIVKHKREGIENYYSIVGGKLTTYRSLSEELVNLFSKNKSKTEKQGLNGLSSYMIQGNFRQQAVQDMADKYGLSLKTVFHLMHIYGSQVRLLMSLFQEGFVAQDGSNRDLKAKIHPDFQDIEAQILFAIRFEEAKTIEDIIDRRLTMGLLRDFKSGDYDSVLELVANYLVKELELVVSSAQLVKSYKES